MQSPEQLLSELSRLDINLSVADSKLRCSAPKGAMTPLLRDHIKRYKPDLIRLLERQQQDTAHRKKGTLPIISREGELPLSFSQHRIWLLSKLDPDNHFTGNIHFGFEIKGSLNISALEKTLDALIQRHEVFRIGCKTINGKPKQSLASTTEFKLTVQDLSTLSVQEKQTVTAQTAERCALAPFDLTRAPILRAALLKTDKHEYTLLLATHLYIFDGWSTALLFKELSELYESFHTKQPSTLPSLSVQYADFAHWHHNWFKGAEEVRQKTWWQEKLANTQLLINFPLDHPRQSDTVGKSDRVEFTLPAFLSEAIRHLSQQAGVTLFITLLAAFQTLLYGYTRQEKLATGTIVSNRRLAETETMIGSFANNILIASDFSSGTRFQGLLERVAKTSREAYANQDLPFEDLLGSLNANLTRNPLFRNMFVLHQHQSQANQKEGLSLTGLHVKKLPDIKTLSKYDLELVMVDRNGGLSGLFVYNADIFNRSTIERLRDNFFIVLQQAINNPLFLLEELPVFDQDKERRANAVKAKRTEYIAPSTQSEIAISHIWQDLLGIEKIGIHEPFSDLGGHSLLAICLINALKAELNMEVAPVSLYQFPTISELAELMDNNSSCNRQGQHVPLV